MLPLSNLSVTHLPRFTMFRALTTQTLSDIGYTYLNPRIRFS